jgi:hypothetical protein
MSWIFSPSSPFATKAHRYRTESVVPRIALAFAVGIGCGVVYSGAPKAPNAARTAAAVSDAASATKAAPISRAGDADPNQAAEKADPAARARPAGPAFALAGASDDGNVGGVAKQERSESLDRPERVAPAASAPVPVPAVRPEATGTPKPTVPALAQAPAVAALQPPADVGSNPIVSPEPETKPARRSEPKRTPARPRAPASRDRDDERLRYVGSRVMPDGNRVPIYRRVERPRGADYWFGRDDYERRPRFGFFD